jgi:peptidoglycan/LPS O-acetylase OafA/YrhL
MIWRPLLVPRFDIAAQPLAPPAELPRGHIPALDAVRGLAIVLVTLYRFGGGGEEHARAIEHSAVVGLGQRGVDLFFVLSGFLITGILFDAKGRERYFRNFYVRRALRIFPLYFGALAALLIALPALVPSTAAAFQPAIDQQAWLWLYGANVLQAIRGAWCLGPLNHFWSLAIEEHFYLLWPAVIYFTSRKTAMRLCGLLIFGSVAARAAWLATGGNDVAAEVLTPLRMDGLVLGGWIALAARGPGGLGRLAASAQPVLCLLLPVALLADLTGRRLVGLTDAAWAGACGALLVLVIAATRHSLLARVGSSRGLQFFGKYSYAMYVFQLPLAWLVAPLITASSLATSLGSPFIGQTVYAAMLFAATTLAALASWHLFEKRLLELKHRFGG